jgi:NitT/TauT family transport system substrate-binding protein
MLHRRSVIRSSLAAIGALSVCAPAVVRGQGKTPVKIRYNEVVHAVLYAPAYVAMTNGYFKDVGLDLEMTTANGGDKAMAAPISG